MVNLKKRFAQANNNFFVAVIIIIIIFIMNIVIKNSNNNILLKKRKKKFFETVSKTHCSRLGLNLRPSSFLPTYLTTYLTCPNDLGYPTICEIRCFLMHLVGDLTINHFRHYMFSYVIADTVANTSLIL